MGPVGTRFGCRCFNTEAIDAGHVRNGGKGSPKLCHVVERLTVEPDTHSRSPACNAEVAGPPALFFLRRGKPHMEI